MTLTRRARARARHDHKLFQIVIAIRIFPSENASRVSEGNSRDNEAKPLFGVVLDNIRCCHRQDDTRKPCAHRHYRAPVRCVSHHQLPESVATGEKVSFSDGDEVLPFRRAQTLYRRLVADMDRRLVGAGFVPSERRVLLELWGHEGRTDAAIAAVLGMDRPQLSRSVRSLIEAGLVDHQAAPDHNRQRLLELTDEGRRVAQELSRAWASALMEQIASLSDEDRVRTLESSQAFVERGRVRSNLFPLSVREFESADAIWVLEQAEFQRKSRPRNRLYVAAVANDIALALKGPNAPGYTATIDRKIVGTCLLAPQPDGLHVGVGGFFVPGAKPDAEIAGRLLDACIRLARDNTYIAINAAVDRRDAYQDSALAEAGFTRLRPDRETLVYGPPEHWRSYRFQLPLLPASY